MNWGHKIIIVFAVFAAGMLTLVTKSMRTKIDMVTQDYYGEELKYQQVIDGKQNAAGLSAPIMVAQPEEGIMITYPRELLGKTINGRLTFYRPSDAGKDIHLSLQPDPSGHQLINRQLFIKGQYRMKVQWTINDQPFYQEQPIHIH
ncbi:FixH family protein [Chitinophaga sp. 22321]|uniref:FixH family protein n=1 Tax=Chitinophaga hostae TaxID=2831022 RepID=A0ABS5IT58_9BACT|nr:FixH family protein [Chitinophaga hostae]MBS0025926.1 FixH family protein [Chitinophaga hostae]